MDIQYVTDRTRLDGPPPWE